MILLSPSHVTQLVDRLGPEQPGPLVGPHVALTGNGAIFVDRWPEPRAVLATTADNQDLVGDPAALTPADLRAHVAGFVSAPASFAPVLRATFPDMAVWDRVIYHLERPPHATPPPVGATVRRLGSDDAHHLWALSRGSAWIAKTWSGPQGLAASGMAWGAFVRERLVAVACVFFVGRYFEDIGVVTEPEYRGRGLSAACAQAVCDDIRARGRTPSWTTSPDNGASMRVADKLGFTLQRRDVLYVVGIPIP